MLWECSISSIILFSLPIQFDNLQLLNELKINKQYIRDREKKIEIEINQLTEIIYIQKDSWKKSYD